MPRKPTTKGPTLTNYVRVVENPSCFTIDGKKRARPYSTVPAQNICMKIKTTSTELRERKTSFMLKCGSTQRPGRSRAKRVIMILTKYVIIDILQ